MRLLAASPASYLFSFFSHYSGTGISPLLPHLPLLRLPPTRVRMEGKIPYFNFEGEKIHPMELELELELELV